MLPFCLVVVCTAYAAVVTGCWYKLLHKVLQVLRPSTIVCIVHIVILLAKSAGCAIPTRVVLACRNSLPFLKKKKVLPFWGVANQQRV